MRLLKLYANKPGFKTVDFNYQGVSIIVGKRHNNDYHQNKKNTYNSVGKSLIVALVHYCLGSQKNPEFEQKLSDWEFTLDVQLDGATHIITRKCSNQSVIYLDAVETPLKEFTDFLASKAFSIPANTKFLTFRTLITRFIRPQKISYTSYDTYYKEEQQIQTLINTAFLLGLDIDLVLKKVSLKDEYDEVEDMRSAIEKDTIIKSFFAEHEGDDVEIDIVDLKEQIKKLAKSLSEYRVAEDYNEVVKLADQLKVEIKSLENKAATLKTAIANIKKSIDVTPDLPKKKIEQLYSEAQIQLPDIVFRRLAEVEEFNKKLLDNRTIRLMTEKKTFEHRLSKIETEIKYLGRQKDAKLEYLNTRGALDEFTKMNEQLKDFQLRLASVEKYRDLKQEYKKKIEELKRDFSLENTHTIDYLKNNRELSEGTILTFKKLAAEFYENKRAGIDIKNNDGINKVRYEIKAKIDDDKGDGVNDVKIFCFDWTLLLGRHNHKIDFLFHDSRLLSEIDSRQQEALFRVAYKNSIENDLQYIVSINENVLTTLQMEMEEEDYKKIISDNIVLELTDESDESKLLGFKIDLDYDKE